LADSIFFGDLLLDLLDFWDFDSSSCRLSSGDEEGSLSLDLFPASFPLLESERSSSFLGLREWLSDLDDDPLSLRPIFSAFSFFASSAEVLHFPVAVDDAEDEQPLFSLVVDGREVVCTGGSPSAKEGPTMRPANWSGGERQS